MTTMVFDSGVLIGIADGDPVVRAYLRAAYTDPVAPASGRVVPSVVLAECVRGSARDAVINQFLKGAVVAPIDESAGRRAGALLAMVGGNATVDAVVVAVASARPDRVVVTVDGGDVAPLAAAAGVRVDVLKR